MDYDSPWKDAIEGYFHAFPAFFSPTTEADIDWTRDSESLDGELRKLVVGGEVGKVPADKVITLFNKSGDPRYLHVEVQGRGHEEFPRRMYIYNYRSRDLFGQPVGSLAILADEDRDWRPCEHVEETVESKTIFTFRAIKLLDWVGQEAQLDADPNPFALMIRAHLGSQALRNDVRSRKDLKWLLIQQLYWRFPEQQDAVRRHRILDWLLILPDQHEKDLVQRLFQFEKERNVTFISPMERFGIEKGIEKRREQGVEMGREEMLQNLPAAKFGEEGKALLLAWQRKLTPESAKTLMAELVAAGSVEDARQALERVPQ
jgi:hypothetical protein